MFEELKKRIRNCSMCKTLFGFQPHPIIWGEEDAKIVQISQAPSSSVDKSGKPFTDMSGKTIRSWYQLTEEEFYDPFCFYITSLAHCYPGKDKNGNDKAPPKCCFTKWVEKELKMIHNEIYIVVGAKAARVFFPKSNFEELVFHDQTWNHKLMIVLPHPSPLNKKWLKDHPQFEKERLKEIRKIIHQILK